MSKKPTAPQRNIVVKTPTTKAAVQRVQRSTSTKNGDSQSGYSSRLQSTVDKKGTPSQTSSSNQSQHRDKGASTTTAQHRSAANNNANQLNPNHKQFYRSRGLPGRPEAWNAGEATSAPTSHVHLR